MVNSLDTSKLPLEKQEKQKFNSKNDDGSCQRCEESRNRNAFIFFTSSPGLLQGRFQIRRLHAATDQTSMISGRVDAKTLCNAMHTRNRIKTIEVGYQVGKKKRTAHLTGECRPDQPEQLPRVQKKESSCRE